MLRVLSLFSGIGAFEVALDEENIEWELDHYCEIDKYACQSYNCIHGTTDEDNLKDVTNIDYSKIGDIDLVTYGFPCQDISLAGKGKGFFDEEGNLTRSGLFFNAADVIRHTNPKFAIFENVKNLTGKKFKAEFETVISVLDELGYNTYWKVLNAKDYGIPQNRERVFGISIRKDIDHGYYFPLPVELTLRLKDMLEEQVEEKYYLSQDKVDKFYKKFDETPYALLGGEQQHQSVKKDGISTTLTSSMGTGGDQKILESKRIGGLFDDEKGKHQAGSVWDTDHLSPTLDTMQVGYRQPCIAERTDKTICLNSKGGRGGVEGLQPSLQDRIYDIEGISPACVTSYMPSIAIKEATKKGYAEAEPGDSINLEQPNSKTRRGRVGKGVVQILTTNCNQAVVEPLICASRGRNPNNLSSRKAGEIAVCLIAQPVGNTGGNSYLYQLPDFRIRKLTPRECWRLMGFRDYYFNKVKGVSNTQLYKQAGNSIVVDVLKYIFEELHNQYPEYFSKDEWGSDL